MKEQEIDILIKLTERKTELLKELKQSIIYESKKYHLLKIDNHPKSHALILISSGQMVKHGTAQQIKSYCRTRKIKENEIYKNPDYE